MRADALEMYARLMIRRLRPASSSKCYCITLSANSSSPRVQNATGSPKSIFFGSARVVAILRCFSSPRCFSTAMRINPMTLTKKDQSSKLPPTGERANDDPHAASPP